MKLGTALLVALLLPMPVGATHATPNAAVTNVRLDVLGSPACITRDELAARVLARSTRIRFVDASALSAQVSVESPRPGMVIAELVMASADGKRSPRRIVVQSCSEAADAVALIITVTLDPTLAKRPVPGVPRERSPDKDSEATSSPAAEAVVAKSAPAEPSSAPSPQPTAKPTEPPAIDKEPAPPAKPDIEEPPSASSPVAATRRFGVSGGAQSIAGPAPAVMPGFAFYGLAALDRDSPWSPAVHIGFTRVWRADLSEPGGKASFTLDAASLDVCGLRLHWSMFEARACGAALVGRMTARGAAFTDTPGTSTRPFAVAGGAVLVSAGLGATIELLARLSVGATLVRDAYDFAPPAFYRAGPLTTAASLGLGARWP